MAPIDDDTLDRLLTRHLSSRLGGQVGRSAAAFRQRLSDDEAERTAGLTAPLRLAGFWQRPGGRMAGVIGTAVAASVATLLLTPRAGVDRPGGSGTSIVATQQSTPDDIGPSPSADRPVVRYVYNRTLDEGTITPGNAGTPWRRVRHQQVEHLRYYDSARRAWVEVTVPKEDVEHIELDTY